MALASSRCSWTRRSGRVPGALQRLTASLDAADPQVRTFGSLALAAFNRTLAIERLAIEAKSPEAWHRSRASEFLLQLGDSRGIPRTP